MKPKRLTIIFFSIMMLAATPRAMSHFNNYADAVYTKVEAEWLNILLGVATPNDIEKSTVTPKTEQPPVICGESARLDVEPSVNKSRTYINSSPSSLVAKKRTFEYKLTNTLSESAAKWSASMPDGVNFDRKAFEKIVHSSLLPDAPVAANSGERAKIEYLWSLSQSATGGKRKTARALVRELTSLNAKKSPSGIFAPVEYVRDSVQPSDVDSDVAEQVTSPGQVSSEESMR